MSCLRLKIADFLELTDVCGSDAVSDVAVLTSLVLEHFAFLKPPLSVEIEGDDLLVYYGEESASAQSEAARLAGKGAKRASRGDYANAIDVLKRALDLQPSLHEARRDLAMAYMETGDAEKAVDHLIEVLRLRPGDAWSWVVLANLYLGPKDDIETAERFLRKALELKPDDAWALNSLAAISHKSGRDAEAVALFDEAIAANPEFANPYYGKAATLAAMEQHDEAKATLDQLFAMGQIPDARTRTVYEQARRLYVEIEMAIVERDESAMFKCVQDYRAELEQASGYPVRTEEGEFKDSAGARIQMAWTHGRDHHRLTTRRGLPPAFLAHLQAHELTHLKIETEARQAGRNRFFTSTPKSMKAAHHSLASDANKLQRSGYSPDQIQRLHDALIRGLCGFLYNCPLDMLIERELHGRFPLLRPSQFLSLRHLAAESLEANTNREIVKVSPRKVVLASLALNGAYGLFLDELFEGASAFAAPYRKIGNFEMARRLHDHWNERAPTLALGGGGMSMPSWMNSPTC